MCIAGTGTVEVSGEDIHLEKWDIANIPSMQVYRHRNTGSDLFVRLTYTNTPLLEKLGVHYVEEDPSISTRLKQREEWHPQSSALDLDLGTGGARMRSYEYLVDIDVVRSEQRRRHPSREMGHRQHPVDAGLSASQYRQRSVRPPHLHEHPAARKTRRPLCRGGSVDQHPAEAAGRMASPVLGARSRSRHRRGADAQLRISRRYRRRRIARLALALGGGEEQPALCAADQQSRHHAALQSGHRASQRHHP